jgi:hypothetical protein
MVDINFHLTYKKNEDIVTRGIAGETLLVPIRDKLADMQRIFALSGVAEYVWQALDGQKSLSEIRDGILATFNVEQEQVDADVKEFMAELLDAGLVVEM